jgi:hypothetical protein
MPWVDTEIDKHYKFIPKSPEFYTENQDLKMFKFVKQVYSTLEVEARHLAIDEEWKKEREMKKKIGKFDRSFYKKTLIK